MKRSGGEWKRVLRRRGGEGREEEGKGGEGSTKEERRGEGKRKPRGMRRGRRARGDRERMVVNIVIFLLPQFDGGASHS